MSRLQLIFGALLLVFALHESPLGPLHKHFLPRVSAPSPSGRCTLVAYRIPLLWAMPGAGSDQLALVELQSTPGWAMRRARGPDEEIFYRDVEVSWDPEVVWYGRARMMQISGCGSTSRG